jgi:hypothetical protein
MLPGTTVLHQAGPFQLREVTGDPRLAHAKDFLELGHGQLCFMKKKEEPEAGGIGQESEQINS